MSIAADIVPYAQLLGTLIALIGGAIALQNLRLNARTNKSKFIVDLTESIIKDKEVTDFWYRLDYDDWKFDLTNFRRSAEERHIDILLSRCAVIGQVLRAGSVSKADLTNIFILIRQVFSNEEIRNYLRFNMLDFYRDAGRLETQWPDALYLYGELLKWHAHNRRGRAQDDEQEIKKHTDFVAELNRIPSDGSLREEIAHRIKYDRPIP
jgi:hypothetical protein